VLHCSQDFYNYQSDLTRFSKATFGVYDPVFIRTNIENGLGIFAGSAPSTISIPIP
jgi:hypothetical protein